MKLGMVVLPSCTRQEIMASLGTAANAAPKPSVQVARITPVAKEHLIRRSPALARMSPQLVLHKSFPAQA